MAYARADKALRSTAMFSIGSTTWRKIPMSPMPATPPRAVLVLIGLSMVWRKDAGQCGVFTVASTSNRTRPATGLWIKVRAGTDSLSALWPSKGQSRYGSENSASARRHVLLRVARACVERAKVHRGTRCSAVELERHRHPAFQRKAIVRRFGHYRP